MGMAQFLEHTSTVRRLARGSTPMRPATIATLRPNKFDMIFVCFAFTNKLCGAILTPSTPKGLVISLYLKRTGEIMVCLHPCGVEGRMMME